MASKIILIITAAFYIPMLWAEEDSVLPSASEAADIYPNIYFKDFNPQTVLDLIERLPGFSLDGGKDVRGFATGAGNVLIDGERPSSKISIEEVLTRIPADTVDRIEVIRGSIGSSEAAGQAIVANIIRIQVAHSGNWRLQQERAADGRYNLKGEVTRVQQLGPWDITTQVRATLDRQPLSGSRVLRDAAGDLELYQNENRPSELVDGDASITAERTVAGGQLTLNGRLRRFAFDVDTERDGFFGRIPDGQPDRHFMLVSQRDGSNAELAIDWSRALNNSWSLKLLSLSSYQSRDQEQQTLTWQPVDTIIAGSSFVSASDAIESILRVTMGKQGDHKVKPEWGAELAFNRLDSHLSLLTMDQGGIQRIELPAANVVVDELRAQVFGSLIWSVADKTRLETGVAAELSEISVSGDAKNTQSFFFIKPFLNVTYDLRKDLQLRMGVRRSVGQLDFRDFAASASAVDDRLTAGNPELGPDQATRFSMALDWRPESQLAINMEVFHEWRSDVLEESILPSGGQGIANVGSARVWGITSNVSVPLSRWLPGGLLEVEATFLDSTYYDLITDLDRSVSSIDSPDVFAEFRQDLNQKGFAWGISYRAPLEGPFFFVDEESFNKDGRHWSVFMESTQLFAAKTRLELSGIGGQHFIRERRFFDPDRSGAFTGSELIDRERGMVIRLIVSKQF